MPRTRSGPVGRRITRSISATQTDEAVRTGQEEDDGQAIALRGGNGLSSDEDGLFDDHHHHHEARPRSRARKVVVRPRVPGLNKEPDYKPKGYDGYKDVPKQVTHEAKMRMLGVDESLLEPLADDDVLTRWFGPRRSLSELSEDGAADDLLRKLGVGLRRKWKPTQMRFKNPWPQGEIEDDDWYKYLFQDLEMRVKKFADTHFGELGGMGDIKTAGESLMAYLPKACHGWLCDFVDHAYSLWLRGFTDSFYHHATLVAKNDNKCVGWEKLLASRLHRPLLVRGIVMKVLQTSVFNKLLFGAEEAAEVMLATQDEVTIQMDGYQRTDLRSQLVRATLQGDTLPALFWPHVDALTARLTTLLLPMVELMDANFAASRAHSLRKVYQDLHHIVSEAGYLSVAIRQSRTIFRFTWPHPSQLWDHDQHNAAPGVYELSKEVAELQDEETEKQWLKEQKKLQEKKTPDDDQEPEDPVFYPHPRAALVQITMAPCLHRFIAHKDIGEPDGHTESKLAHAQVAYYSGFADPSHEDTESYPSLGEFISDCRWRAWATPQRWVRAVWAWRYVAAVLLTVFALLFAANASRFGVEQANQTMRHMLGELKEGLLDALDAPIRVSKEPWRQEELTFLSKALASLSAFVWTLIASLFGALKLVYTVLVKTFPE